MNLIALLNPEISMYKLTQLTTQNAPQSMTALAMVMSEPCINTLKRLLSFA